MVTLRPTPATWTERKASKGRLEGWLWPLQLEREWRLGKGGGGKAQCSPQDLQQLDQLSLMDSIIYVTLMSYRQKPSPLFPLPGAGESPGGAAVNLGYAEGQTKCMTP